MGVGADLEIGAVHDRMQEGARRADPPALVDGALEIADAFLPGAVVIVVARDPHADGAVDEGVAQRVAPVDVGDRPLAVATAIGAVVATADAALAAFEIGQDIGIGPAAIAHLAPGVEIRPLAAIIDMAVDRAGAAQRLAARRIDRAPRRARARFGFEVPVHLRMDQRLHEARGDMDPRVAVAPAGLEHANGGVARRQPVGKHRSGRTGSDDDVVERVGHNDLPGLESASMPNSPRPDQPRRRISAAPEPSNRYGTGQNCRRGTTGPAGRCASTWR